MWMLHVACLRFTLGGIPGEAAEIAGLSVVYNRQGIPTELGMCDG